MTALFVLLTSLAFGADPVEASVADRVSETLAARHDVGCPAVFELGDTAQVRAALVDVAAQELPPWAPLRAASCLTELAASDPLAWAAARDLIDVPGKPGLALAVTQRLDHLDSARAEELAKRALARAEHEPRLATKIVPAVTRSEHAAVRALVPVAVGTD